MFEFYLCNRWLFMNVLSRQKTGFDFAMYLFSLAIPVNLNHTATPGTFCLTFHHFAKIAMGRVTPANATAKAKVSLSPSMYASTMPGICSAEKTSRSSVAPVATTSAGLTPGTRAGIRAFSRLL